MRLMLYPFLPMYVVLPLRPLTDDYFFFTSPSSLYRLGTIVAVHEKLNVLQMAFPSPHCPWNRLAARRRKERSLPWMMT